MCSVRSLLGRRGWLFPAAMLAASAMGLGAAGCDKAGGLLVVQGGGTVQGNAPADGGTPAIDFVSGGTVAQSGKFTVVYTFGQATPNQGVDKDPDHRLNGGLVGGMQ
jgi:hypothetical protein